MGWWWWGKQDVSINEFFENPNILVEKCFCTVLTITLVTVIFISSSTTMKWIVKIRYHAVHRFLKKTLKYKKLKIKRN